jgi:hypothetical protein
LRNEAALMPGPVPKRRSQRRRRNKPSTPVTSAPTSARSPALAADPSWHPVACQWLESLAASGQAVFYEPSDWAVAQLVAESMSRELAPQPFAVGDRVELVSLPPKASSVAAWLKASTALLATAADRRRLRLELDRGGPADAAGAPANLAEYRRRLRGGRPPAPPGSAS